MDFRYIESIDSCVNIYNVGFFIRHREMKQKNWALKTSIAVIALLVIVFIGIVSVSNVRRGQSYTNTDYKGSGFRFGDPQINLRDDLYLYVEGDDRFAESLQSSLTETLEREGIKVSITEELMEGYANQVLAVLVTEKDIDYNPFMPRAMVEIRFVYFSNGNTTHFDDIIQEKPLSISDEGSGAVQEGTINISDKTEGFASYKAYIELLTSTAAENVFEHLPED